MVGTVHKHQTPGFAVAVVGNHVVIGHWRLGLIRQQVAPLLHRAQPKALKADLVQGQQLLHQFSPATVPALRHDIAARQIQQKLLERGQPAVYLLMVALVVVAEQAAIAAGFALSVLIHQIRFLQGQSSLPIPVAHLECRGALHQATEHPGDTFCRLIDQQRRGLGFVRHQLGGELAGIQLESHLDAALEGIAQREQISRLPRAVNAKKQGVLTILHEGRDLHVSLIGGVLVVRAGRQI